MRVVLQNRANYQLSLAGDSIQLLKTREYLAKAGIEAVIDNRPNLDLAAYDLVHLFNLIPVAETYQYYINARRQHKAQVLSTVFWGPEEFFQASSDPEQLRDWWQKTGSLRQEILNGTSLILPNSTLELEALRNSFDPLPPAVVVPNAADRSFAFAGPGRFIQKYQWRDFLLTVGRICRRKNQLSLIKVAQKMKLPLVIIGPVNDSLYYQECRRQSAGQKVLFIDTLNPSELASAYAAARVHALVSWYDTPGLVSLEAALAGCAVVSTNRGSAREYFEDKAFYCDPGDLTSIAQAVSAAWNAGKDTSLKERVLANYTWERVAEITKEAYQKIIVSS
jgi:glycosyltransferase involved in cell wall biosynthesis